MTISILCEAMEPPPVLLPASQLRCSGRRMGRHPLHAEQSNLRAAARSGTSCEVSQGSGAPGVSARWGARIVRSTRARNSCSGHAPWGPIALVLKQAFASDHGPGCRPGSDPITAVDRSQSGSRARGRSPMSAGSPAGLRAAPASGRTGTRRRRAPRRAGRSAPGPRSAPPVPPVSRGPDGMSTSSAATSSSPASDRKISCSASRASSAFCRICRARRSTAGACWRYSCSRSAAFIGTETAGAYVTHVSYGSAASDRRAVASVKNLPLGANAITGPS